MSPPTPESRRAAQFADLLNEVGLKAEVRPQTQRPGLIKVAVHHAGRACGHVRIHHRPTAKTGEQFTPYYEIDDEAVRGVLGLCWNRQPRAAKAIVAGMSASAPAPLASGTPYHMYVACHVVGDRRGYGVLILHDGDPVGELAGPLAEWATEITGRLEGVLEGLRWCKAHDVGEVTIHYDRPVMHDLAIGRSAPRYSFTQSYVRQVQESPVKPLWRRVVPLGEDRMDERAVALAETGAQMSLARDEGSVAQF